MTTPSTVPTSGAVVYFAGSDWDSVAGTDRRLVTALGRVRPVLWVEPPVSMVTRLRGRGDSSRGLAEVAPGVTRLRITAPPFASRWGMRSLTSAWRSRIVTRTAARLGTPVAATVVASPRELFPMRLGGARILYVTDDWQAGAAMMGLSLARITRDLRLNTRRADLVAAVSPSLAARLADGGSSVVELLPNGCDVPESLPSVARSRSAIIVGQLNERLDLDLLAGVADAQIPLTIIGPRTERDSDTRAGLDGLIARPNVDYLGELPAADLGPHLALAAVGLTPYLDNEFNRASFPLKTLEYLAHGLAVVSTDLPAVAWLATDLIAVGHGREDFIAEVTRAIASAEEEDPRRVIFARSHSWDTRAAQLIRRIEDLLAVPPRQRAIPAMTGEGVADG